MTIKELEQTLDMGRANIRYYEKEGLLAPSREKNGYRDYSEDDVQALRKIQLLRQLGMSVEEIRSLQRGEVALGESLTRQLARLEAHRAETEQALKICAVLRERETSYDTLEAEDYLKQWQEGESWAAAKESDQLPTVGHPVLRFLARFLDLALYEVVWVALRMLVLRMNPEHIRILDLIVGYGAMVLLEPLLLSTWGFTPGKWLMGLTVRNAEGGKLRYSQAVNRTLLVLWWGLGLSIPIYNLYRLYKSCNACEEGAVLPWDEETAYTIRDTKGWRPVLVLAARGAVLGLSVVIALQAQMPMHRGTLTVGQLEESIRDACRYRGIESSLLEQERKTVQEGNVAIGMEAPAAVKMGMDVSPENTVLGVFVHETVTDPEMFFFHRMEPLIVAYSLVGADEEYNLFTLPEATWLDWLTTLDTRPTQREAAGWRMEYEVEYEGMEPFGEGLFRTEGATDAWVRWQFTITKVE